MTFDHNVIIMVRLMMMMMMKIKVQAANSCNKSNCWLHKTERKLFLADRNQTLLERKWKHAIIF